MQELKQKLSRRAVSPEELGAVLVKLREYGLTDDRKFSEAYAETRLRNRGFGQRRVLRELRAKRVAAGIAGQAVERAFAGTDEEQLIEQFLARKYRGKDLASFLGEQKNLASAFRRLRVAGFGGTAALSVLRRYTRKAEGLPDVRDEE